MTNMELKEWLRRNSSGVYRPSADAADRLDKLEEVVSIFVDRLKELGVKDPAVERTIVLAESMLERNVSPPCPCGCRIFEYEVSGAWAGPVPNNMFSAGTHPKAQCYRCGRPLP